MSLGRPFAWLWGASAVSALGTWLAFDAFGVVAILVLHASPLAVAALAAAGLAAGALVAVPLGPWVERRRKRRVMIGSDLVRCVALLSVPLAYALEHLTYVQLVVISVVVAAADIGFKASSGACLKGLVAPGEPLLTANARIETSNWTATAIGPPLGGLAIGLLGPVVTVIANAASFVLSALGLRAMGPDDERPAPATGGMRAGDLVAGWRFIRADPVLRALLTNAAAFNGLVMATAPAMAVLMLRDLDFAPWEYGLAFGAPCVGGLLGARAARRLVARHGSARILRTTGVLRACWSVGLAFVMAGTGGLVLVLVVQFGLVACCGAFNPVSATVRLERTPADRVARTLAAWSVTTSLSIATLTALWGVLAQLTSPRAAVATAGVLLLATPLLLPRGERAPRPARAAALPRLSRGRS